MRKLLIFLLKGYRYLISPFLGNNCRFYPSCSDYAETAINRFGVFKGSWLAICRLGKCHPWHTGGIDQVPEEAGNQPHKHSLHHCSNNSDI